MSVATYRLIPSDITVHFWRPDLAWPWEQANPPTDDPAPPPVPPVQETGEQA